MYECWRLPAFPSVGGSDGRGYAAARCDGDGLGRLAVRGIGLETW
jgi:hypothetical protein